MAKGAEGTQPAGERVPGEDAWLNELMQCFYGTGSVRNRMRTVLRAYRANLSQQRAAQPADGAPVSDMRTAFEHWHRERWPTMPMKRTGKSGRYDDPGINDEWLSFKRAAEWLTTQPADGALREALEHIVKVASGESQVANDDTEGMAYIDKYARRALAAQR